eukprot:m.516706 g.516706  ORF g.516706 m.516706 type:complete len:69 (-) comp21931_c0_seq1:259-465(-)
MNHGHRAWEAHEPGTLDAAERNKGTMQIDCSDSALLGCFKTLALSNQGRTTPPPHAQHASNASTPSTA